ncbi:Putative transposase (identified by ISEscan HMM) [Klebsiella pneumoniae]|nr:Putative transposase (identified by ISEscan HMM) [Klebsiella pneumoniae]
MAAGRICTGPSTAGAALSILSLLRRNSKAYRFLGKILNNVKKWQIRDSSTDKAPAYGRALALLKREGRCPSDVEHRQIKYRNNVIECDHGKLKRIIGATLV